MLVEVEAEVEDEALRVANIRGNVVVVFEGRGCCFDCRLSKSK